MDQVEIDVIQAPGFVLTLGLRESMFFAVVIVPEFGDDKVVLALDEAFVDSTLDALSCFFLILVVVSTVKETVAYFDGLDDGISLPNLESVSRVYMSSDSHCRLYRRPGQLVPSKDRSL